MLEKTSNTIATQKTMIYLCMVIYSKLKNSWKLQKIEITNKTGINTTIGIATLISYVAAISRIKSCFLSHEFLKTEADDDACMCVC